MRQKHVSLHGPFGRNWEALRTAGSKQPTDPNTGTEVDHKAKEMASNPGHANKEGYETVPEISVSW